MAIANSQPNQQPSPSDLLDRQWAEPAALAGMAAAALGIAAVIVATVSYGQLRIGMVLSQLIWLVMFGAAGVVSVVLLRGRQWAQQALLAFWAVVLIGEIVFALSAVLWGAPAWWTWRVPLAAVVLPAIAVSAVVFVLLMLAAAPRTRLRYGSVVTASLAAAVALAIVVNMIAQKDYVRTSVQAFGRFGLSERSKTIIRDLNTPVGLTCVYTGPESERLGTSYGLQVMELLNDMAEYGRRYNQQITVVNASNDTERADVIDRLKEEVSDEASDHIDYLKSFIQRSDALTGLLQVEAGQWASIGPGSYLQQWDLPRRIDAWLGEAAKSCEDLRADLTSQLGAPSLPDYAAMVERVTGYLRTTRLGLTQLATPMEQLETIPKKVAANRDKTLRALRECAASARKMAEAVGSRDAPVPEDPAAALRQYVRAMRRAAERAHDAARLLDNIAGADNQPLVDGAADWVIRSDAAGRGVTPGRLYRTFAVLMAQRAAEVEATVQAAKTEFLVEQFPAFRTEAAIFARAMTDEDQTIPNAIDRLTDVDAATRRLFERAEKGTFFQPLLVALGDVLAAGEKLPALRPNPLVEQLREHNIVIVEAAGKTEVIPFKAVWPLKEETLTSLRPSDEPPKRVFNGNAAIGSRILGMTHEPFATVLITYYQVPMDPQLLRWTPPAAIEPGELAELTRRLEEANFRVERWNLTGEMPDVPAEMAKLLLVLPPAPPTFVWGRQPPPSFGQAELAKVGAAIDDGVPAIFLVGFIQPQQLMPGRPIQPPYGYSDYLGQNWGIDVRSGYLIVSAVPDETTPDRYRINEDRLSYLPLNWFTDHPIGRPLQGQRMLWGAICPVLIDGGAPEGVSAEPLLTVPPSWRGFTWATENIIDLVVQFRTREGSFVSPDYDKGDLPVPNDDVGLPVAVAATRPSQTDAQGAEAPTTAPARQAVRIVVLGVGTSMVDGYLAANVNVHDRSGNSISQEPPRANAELVINSAYWALGRHEKIAAGPLRIKPIRPMRTGTWTALWILCAVVLPVLAVSAGGLVMAIRRR